MALMDIPDLGLTLERVARVLNPGGWFVFSFLHPCYHTPASDEQNSPDGKRQRTVKGYWDEGHWRSENQRVRPASSAPITARSAPISMPFATPVWVIERMLEPSAAGHQARARPVWTEVPAGLIVRCHKLP